MPTFRVEIGFRASIRRLMSMHDRSELADGASGLPGIAVRRDNAGGYVATLSVDVDDYRDAGAVAWEQVCMALQAFALLGHMFDPVPWGIRTILVEASAEGDGRNRKRGGPQGRITLDEYIAGQEHVAVVKHLPTLDGAGYLYTRIQEADATLRRTVELYYLANQASSDDVRFLLMMTVMDALVTRNVHPKPIVKRTLTRAQVKQLVQQLDNLFGCYEMPPNDRKTLCDMVRQVHGEPFSERLVFYLESRSISDVSRSTAHLWWGLRALMAHGTTVDVETIRRETPLLSESVRTALSVELGLITPTA